MVPDGVTKIGEKAFADCKSLKGIWVPEGVTEIGRGAFDGCIYLRSVILPESLTVIGEGAFCSCRELTGIALPKGVREIGEGAFMDCDRLEEILPAANHPRYRNEDGFLLDQERKTLLWCPAVRMGSCTVPEGTERIGDAAFWGCRWLDRIVLPKTLKSIGCHAFESCINLEEILPEAGSPRYGAEDGFLLDRESKTLLWCSTLRTGSCQVPCGVEIIGSEAFLRCSGLTNVVLPLGVQRIEVGAFAACGQLQRIQLPGSVTEIGAYTFVSCQSLQDICLPEHLREISAHTFLGCQSLQSIKVPACVVKIGESAFEECTSLQNVQLPMYLKVIDGKAFHHCTELAEVRLPEGLQRIGVRAFEGCEKLRSITVPEGVEEIGESAFSGCTGLQRMVLPKSLQRLGVRALDVCTALEELRLAEDNPGYRLEDGLLLEEESKTVLWCPAGRTGSCQVPADVENIGESAFRNCTELKEVLLPGGLRRIGDGAFNACANLQNIHIPEGVISIGRFAFNGCRRLEGITMPESVESIGGNAFRQCRNLCVRMAGKPEVRTLVFLRKINPQILIAPQLPCAFLKNEECRHAALLGFVLTREEELPYTDEASWREYGRSEKIWLLGKRETDPGILRWLLREKLLTRAEAEDLLPEADTPTRLMLLNYIHETFPAGDKAE